MSLLDLPNFIHAGVPKSASGTLGAVLRQHPQVFRPRQKEPNFFSTDDKFSCGLEWYAQTYFSGANGEAVRADLSIGYSTGFGHDVPARVVSTLGSDVKVLLTFREPAARAYSQYAMARYKGQLESLEFADAVNRALAIGPAVNDADRLRVRTGSYYNSRADMDIFRWCMYIQPGHYADIYRQWAGAVGQGNVLVLFTDFLASDLQGQADRLFDFLGVERIPVQAELRRNEATALRYPWIKRCLNRLYAVAPLRAAMNHPKALKLRKGLRRRLLSQNYVPNTQRPAPDPSAVECLRAHYQHQLVQLAEMVPGPLPPWLEDSQVA